MVPVTEPAGPKGPPLVYRPWTEADIMEAIMDMCSQVQNLDLCGKRLAQLTISSSLTQLAREEDPTEDRVRVRTRGRGRAMDQYNPEIYFTCGLTELQQKTVPVLFKISKKQACFIPHRTNKRDGAE